MTEELPGVSWHDRDGLHIDVRGLAPPGPLVAILGYIDRPGQTGPVVVHHDREPIYLYPELTERGWGYRIVPADPGEVRLVLTMIP